MPGSMDERVVSMEFDNKQFEKNVKKSMKTIDDLKESLDFDDTGKGLDELSKKFSKFGKKNVFSDLDGSCTSLRKGMAILGDSTVSLIGKFAEITKITAMFHAAEAAVRSLERSIKQFTIAPISEGFEKYNTKISAIKTISNATKLGAEQVNEELQRLNWFTDETSASFGNMVENIGKFTSVGRGLSESITAMQGIATWGYQSGAGVAEINRAMYNLSQALGTGSVKLMDWKSIENAGMATKEFKDQAIAAAEAAGKLKRKGDKLFAGGQEVNASNFNATLAKGWFTSDVLMSVLDKYGGFATELRKYMEERGIEQAADALEKMDSERLDKRVKLFKDNYKLFGEKTGKTVEQVQDKINAIMDMDDLEEKEKAVADFARSFGVNMADVSRIKEIENAKEQEKELKKWADKLGVSAADAKKLLDDLAATEESLGSKAFKSSQQSKTLRDAIDATKDAVSTGWMNTMQTIFGGLDESIALWTDVTDILWDLFAAGAGARNNALTHWAEEFAGREDLWGKDGIMHSVMDTIIELKELLGTGFKNVFFPDLEQVLGGKKSQQENRDIRNGVLTTAQLMERREGSYFGKKIKDITTSIKNFGQSIKNFGEKNMGNFLKIFESGATVLKFFGSIISGVFNTISNFVTNTGILQDIVNIATTVADKIKGIVEKIQASGFVTTVLEKIGNTLTWFYDTIKRWVNEISQFFEESGIAQAVRDFFGRIGEFFLGGENDVDENGQKTESAFFRAFGWVSSVKEWINNINLKDILASFGEKLSGVISFFKGIWTSFTGWLETSGVLPTLRSWWDGIKLFFGNVGLVWEALTTGKVGNRKDLNDKQKGLVNGIILFVKKLQKAWDKVKSWFAGAWEWIKEKWGLLIGWLEDTGVLPKIRSIWKTVSDFFGNIGLLWDIFVNKQGKYDPKNLTEDQLSIVQKIENFINKVKEKFEWIKEKFTQIKNTVVGWLESSGILPTLRNWWTEITGWFESLTVPGENGEAGGPLDSVKKFFAGLYETVSGWFGGGKTSESENPKPIAIKGPEVPEIIEDSKGGFFKSIADAFTRDGHFDLFKGISTGISGLFEAIGSIDWAGISGNVFGVMVKVVNGLDDALGELHYQNIIKVLRDFLGIFSSFMWAKAATDLFSTIRSIVKKGKDKSTIEKFTELLGALGTAILEIGIAVLLVAGSMWILSQIDTNKMESAKNVLLGIGIFIAGFFVVVALLNAFLPHADGLPTVFQAIGSMFLEIGIALVLVVASIWLIMRLLESDGSIGDKMKTALIVAGGILIFMTALMVIVSQLSKKTGTLNVAVTVATFAGMAILLVAATVCIMLLQGVPWKEALINAGILSAVLIVIALAARIMNKIEIKAKTIGAMVVLAIVLGIVTAALVLLKDSELGKVAGTAGVIIGSLYALVGLLFILSKIPATGMLKGAAALSGALVILAAGAAAVGLIVSAAGKSVANAFVSIMSSIAAGSTSASLVDTGKVEAVLGLLPKIVTAFNTCGSANPEPAKLVANAAWDVFGYLSLASTSAKNVDVDQFNKIFGEDGTGGIFNAIQTALSGVTDTGWKATSLGTNVERLSESLKLVGQAGLTLEKELSDYGNETYSKGIQNVKDRLTDIQEIVKLATTIGTVGSGEDVRQIDLTVFAEGIANIGAALELYNKALESFENGGANGADTLDKTDVAPLSTENISSALQSVMSALSGVTYDSTQIKAIEGWAGLTKSGDSGTLFALGLTNIANAMGTFSTAAKDFDNANVNNSILALGTLADIHSKISNPAQYKSTIDGVKEWGDSGDPNTQGSFANAISSMGTAMAAFGTSVKDIPGGTVKKATNALNTLSTIYEKLKGKEDMVSTITTVTSGLFGSKTETKTFETLTSSDVLGDFGLGIEHLGSALATFSTYISNKEYNYDENKVNTAVEILQAMVKMQKSLVKMKPGQGLLDKVLFGENGFAKLGENISGLGSRLATFAQELNGADGKGFDIDIDSDRWKNISGVLTYLVGLATDLNNLSSYSEELDKEGNVLSTNLTSGYTLSNLADGITRIVDAVADFNIKMTAVRAVSGGSAVFQLGQWSSANFENIKKMLGSFKEMSIEMKNAGLKEHQFYDLSDFGHDIKEFFGYLDGSKLTDLMSKFEVPGDASSVTDKFAAFGESIKSLVQATTMLHGQSVNTEDISNMGSIISAIMSLDSSNWNTEALDLNAVTLAAQFINGFATRLTSIEAGEGEYTLTGAMTELLEIISSYSTDFFDQGVAAGKQYASGFNQGLNDVDSGKLTPVIDMDESGKVTGGTGIVGVLASMNYATANDILGIAMRLDAIQSHFEAPIKVTDNRSDLINAIGTTNGRLKEIKDEVTLIKSRVDSLKVYMDTGKLVGEIAPALDREFGSGLSRP